MQLSAHDKRFNVSQMAQIEWKIAHQPSQKNLVYIYISPKIKYITKKMLVSYKKKYIYGPEVSIPHSFKIQGGDRCISTQKNPWTFQPIDSMG